MATTTQTWNWDGITRAQIGLGMIDLAILAGLVLSGHLHHGGEPLADPIGAVSVTLPFLVGWVTMSILAGVYAREVYTNSIRTVRVTTVCWIAAANVGLILRSTPYFDGGVTYPFGLVMTATGLVALVLWRVGVAAYSA